MAAPIPGKMKHGARATSSGQAGSTARGAKPARPTNMTATPT